MRIKKSLLITVATLLALGFGDVDRAATQPAACLTATSLDGLVACVEGHMASGLYLYRIETGDRAEVRRMLLIK